MFLTDLNTHNAPYPTGGETGSFHLPSNHLHWILLSQLAKRRLGLRPRTFIWHFWCYNVNLFFFVPPSKRLVVMTYQQIMSNIQSDTQTQWTTDKQSYCRGPMGRLTFPHNRSWWKYTHTNTHTKSQRSLINTKGHRKQNLSAHPKSPPQKYSPAPPKVHHIKNSARPPPLRAGVPGGPL